MRDRLRRLREFITERYDFRSQLEHCQIQLVRAKAELQTVERQRDEILCENGDLKMIISAVRRAVT